MGVQLTEQDVIDIKTYLVDGAADSERTLRDYSEIG
jgi:hypothetical protein